MNFTINKQFNDKKQIDIWVLRFKDNIQDFPAMRKKMSSLSPKSYYSNYAGVKGFVFESEPSIQYLEEQGWTYLDSDDKNITSVKKSPSPKKDWWSIIPQGKIRRNSRFINMIFDNAKFIEIYSYTEGGDSTSEITSPIKVKEFAADLKEKFNDLKYVTMSKDRNDSDSFVMSVHSNNWYTIYVSEDSVKSEAPEPKMEVVNEKEQKLVDKYGYHYGHNFWLLKTPINSDNEKMVSNLVELGELSPSEINDKIRKDVRVGDVLEAYEEEKMEVVNDEQILKFIKHRNGIYNEYKKVFDRLKNNEHLFNILNDYAIEMQHSDFSRSMAQSVIDFQNEPDETNGSYSFSQISEMVNGLYEGKWSSKFDTINDSLIDEQPKSIPIKKVPFVSEAESNYYIPFMNKDKGFKEDKKFFITYQDATEWAKSEFEKFDPDMILMTDKKFESNLKVSEKIKQKALQINSFLGEANYDFQNQFFATGEFYLTPNDENPYSFLIGDATVTDSKRIILQVDTIEYLMDGFNFFTPMASYSKKNLLNVQMRNMSSYAINKMDAIRKTTQRNLNKRAKAEAKDILITDAGGLIMFSNKAFEVKGDYDRIAGFNRDTFEIKYYSEVYKQVTEIKDFIDKYVQNKKDKNLQQNPLNNANKLWSDYKIKSDIIIKSVETEKQWNNTYSAILNIKGRRVPFNSSTSIFGHKTYKTIEEALNGIGDMVNVLSDDGDKPDSDSLPIINEEQGKELNFGEITPSSKEELETTFKSKITFPTRQLAENFAKEWSRKKGLGHTIEAGDVDVAVSIYGITEEDKNWIDNYTEEINKNHITKASNTDLKYNENKIYEANGELITIYFRNSMTGIIVKNQGKLKQYGFKKYAQYDSIPFVDFIPFRKRKVSRLQGSGNDSYLIIVKGHKAPECDIKNVNVKTSDDGLMTTSDWKYRSFDKNWIIDAHKLIDPYIEQHKDDILLYVKDDIKICNPVNLPKTEIEEKKPIKITHKKEGFKNQFQLNEAIIKFIEETKDRDLKDFTKEEKEFIYKYEGSGGLKSQGASDRGVLTEFYTPEVLIKKMWGLAFKYGFKNGKILENSVGVGRFLDYVNFEQNEVDAYEIKKVSARICKILHPIANVKLVKSFAEHFYGTGMRSNTFNPNFVKDYDLVIGNPPYGAFIDDYMMDELATTKIKFQQLEFYFTIRGLDCLKSGGLLVYVVPANIFNHNGKYNKLEKIIEDKAEIMDAYKLPNGTFQTTEVATCILILRKK